MLNQLQKSHDAQARAAATAVASLEALRSELEAADAQAAKSCEQVAQLQTKLASSATPDPSRVTDLETQLRAAKQSEQRMATMLQQSQDENAQLRATLNQRDAAGAPAAVAAPARTTQASLPPAATTVAPVGSPNSPLARQQSHVAAAESVGGSQPRTPRTPRTPRGSARERQLAEAADQIRQLIDRLKRQHTAAQALAVVYLRSQLLLKRRLRLSETARAEAVAAASASKEATREEAAATVAKAAEAARAAAVAEAAEAIAAAHSAASAAAATAATARAEAEEAAATELRALRSEGAAAAAEAARWRGEWEQMGEQLEGATEARRRHGAHLGATAAALETTRQQLSDCRAALQAERARRRHADQVHALMLRLLGAARARLMQLESCFGALATAVPPHAARGTAFVGGPPPQPQPPQRVSSSSTPPYASPEQLAALQLLFSPDFARLAESVPPLDTAATGAAATVKPQKCVPAAVKPRAPEAVAAQWPAAAAAPAAAPTPAALTPAAAEAVEAAVEAAEAIADNSCLPPRAARMLAQEDGRKRTPGGATAVAGLSAALRAQQQLPPARKPRPGSAAACSRLSESSSAPRLTGMGSACTVPWLVGSGFINKEYRNPVAPSAVLPPR